jgi:hypothetical protein
MEKHVGACKTRSSPEGLGSRAPGRMWRSSPLSISHTRTEPSQLAEARSRTSGENATAATQSPCCGVSSSHEQKAQGARAGGEEEDSFHRRTVLRRAAQWSGPGRRSHALACAAPGAPDLSEEPDASQMAVCSGAPACPGVPGGQRTRAQSSARTQSVCPTLRGVVERVIGMRSSLVQEVSERAGVRHQAEE